MKKKTYRTIGLVILGIAVASVAGALCNARKTRREERLSDAANEGYETAHDIIYPEDKRSLKRGKLHYGPVF